MAGSEARRRLATVLFVDIVGSTALASRIGDRRWRDVLSRFHRLARAEVRRRDGRVQDTAGDGLLATFADPSHAIECAAAIVAAAQEIGVNVRGGVHTGTTVEVDGKLQGIAVNIGARVTALAGAAELLTTATVKDLVAGAGFAFEERGPHELKGVEGTWQVFAVRAVSGTPLPEPLTVDESAERIDAGAASRRPLYRRPGTIGAAVVVVAAAIAVPLVVLAGETSSSRAPSLVRIDARDAKVTEVVRDGVTGSFGDLWSEGGTLWQFVGSSRAKLAQRNIVTGRVERLLPLGADVCSCRVAVGFGSVWVARNFASVRGGFGVARGELARIDELSGRRSSIALPGAPTALSIGNGAVWVEEQDRTLVAVDPIDNRVVRRYRPNGIFGTYVSLFSTPGYEWISTVAFGNSVTRFDARTGRQASFPFPAQAELLGGETSHGPVVWVLDTQASTLAQMDPSSGERAASTGLEGNPQQAVSAFGAVWIAAGQLVDRIDVETQQRTTIAMPRGMYASNVVADAATHAVWVGNGTPAAPPPELPGAEGG
jgi:class 3 adenylate cyclase